MATVTADGFFNKKKIYIDVAPGYPMDLFTDTESSHIRVIYAFASPM